MPLLMVTGKSVVEGAQGVKFIVSDVMGDRGQQIDIADVSIKPAKRERPKYKETDKLIPKDRLDPGLQLTQQIVDGGGWH